MLDDLKLASIIAVTAVALAAGGCRCESGEPASGVESRQAGDQAKAGANDDGGDTGVARWCMACAKKGFMACKRADGRKPEADLKREAELMACKDVGISEAGCTPDVLSNVSCGVMK